MKVYVAYCHDRHTDPVIKVFAGPERAIAYARAFMQENMAHPEYITEQEVEGYLYFASYDLEEDHAWVEEVEVDES